MAIPDKRPLKVFLCHAHADRDAVRTLYSRLVKDGVDAWLDKEKLLPGQDWELEIKKAVREADVVVVCLSKQFNQAGFRQKEVKWALDAALEKPEGEIFIIPVRLQECDFPTNLRKWHSVDLFEADGNRRLMHALRIRADKIGAILQKKDNSSIKLIGNRYAEIELEEQKKKILTSKLNKQRSYRKLVLISGVIFVLFVLFGVMRMPHMILPISKNRLTPTASMAEIITNTESLPIVTMQPIYVFD